MFVSNSLTGGGAERVTNLISNGLVARGWDIALVPVNYSGEDLVKSKAKVFGLNRGQGSGYWSTLKAIFLLNFLVLSVNPKVIVLNCELPELMGALLISRRKLLVVEHTSFPWKNREFLGSLVRKILLWRKSTWIAVSDHLQLPAVQIEKSHVIENPITPGQTRANIANGDVAGLIFIGRLSPEKDPEMLLRIASTLDMPVRFMGDGIMLKRLKAEAEAGGIKASFLGRVEDPWSSVRDDELLIIPSKYEGDGLVVLEAANSRIPFLLSDNSDFRRFDFSEHHYCADIQDYVIRIQKYANRIEGLLLPEDKRSSLVEARNLERILDKWEFLLLEKI